MTRLMYSRGRVEHDDQEYFFVMPREELASLCKHLQDEGPPFSVKFNDIELSFSLSEDSAAFLTARSVNDGVEIMASRDELASLAKRIQALSESDEIPDYVAHIHLDLFISDSLTGVSDVVIQRQDKYHP